MEQELADAAEEADDVGIVEGVALSVAHGFEELVDPDGGVDGETFSGEGLETDGAVGGLEDLPEAVDTH